MAIHYLEESRDRTGTKKRKIENNANITNMFLSMKDISPSARMTENHTLIGGPNRLVTPSMNNDGKDLCEVSEFGDGTAMDTRKDECPCGYFHGPGENGHHDIKAVGFTSRPLLRGPD